jgi:hypothetical protein
VRDKAAALLPPPRPDARYARAAPHHPCRARSHSRGALGTARPRTCRRARTRGRSSAHRAAGAGATRGARAVMARVPCEPRAAPEPPAPRRGAKQSGRGSRPCCATAPSPSSTPAPATAGGTALPPCSRPAPTGSSGSRRCRYSQPDLAISTTPLRSHRASRAMTCRHRLVSRWPGRALTWAHRPVRPASAAVEDHWSPSACATNYRSNLDSVGVRAAHLAAYPRLRT